MLAVLTCVTCGSRRELDAATTVAGKDLATWWVQERHHSCSGCYAATCWQSVEGSVCFMDRGHTGRCIPWQERYGDVAGERW